MKDNGRLKVEYTIWCGCPFCECMVWRYLGARTKRDAGCKAKQDYGWAYTRAFGWVCQRCNIECRSPSGRQPSTKSANNSEALEEQPRRKPCGCWFTVACTHQRRIDAPRSVLERLEAEHAAGRIL